MKKNLLKLRFAVLVAVLFACVTGMWAADTQQKAQPVYFVALTAESSSASTGEGMVQLTLKDIKGETMKSQVFLFLNKDLTTSGASSGFDKSVTMRGATISAAEGVENGMIDFGGQLYMTSYAYYLAEAQPAAGSYFAGWTINSSYVDQIVGADGAVTFKVLSDDKNMVSVRTTNMNDWNAEEQAAIATAMTNAIQPENVRHAYAVFRNYLLSNPSVTGGQVDGTAGERVEIKVSIAVDGSNAFDVDRDVASISFSDNEDNNWSKGTLSFDKQTNTLTLPITFTVKDGTEVGVHNSTLTISTKGSKPSMLNIPIAVTVLNPTRPDAILLEGKKEIKTGKLSDLIDQVQTNTYDDPIIRLNRPHEDLLIYSGKKPFTLDLNGNTMGDITLTGGEMTVAYSKFGGSAGNITVEGGKLIMNGGTFNSLTINEGATVEQNGATISGSVTNSGNLTTTQGTFSGGLTSDGMLTLNGGSFAGETAITISGGTATLTRGTIVGTACGVLAKGGETTINKLAAISGKNNSLQAQGGEVTVNCGKFGAPISGTNIAFTSGYFIKEEDYKDMRTDGMTEMQLTTGVEYNEGYRYFLGTAEAATTNKVGVCRIGETSYATLEDALAYANNNPEEEVVIFMTSNYTLPAGHYTVPEKATIVVPMSDTQAKMINESAPKIVYNDLSTDGTHYTEEENKTHEFRRLTFAKGVNIDVFGAIELTCHQYSSNEAYTGQPVGPYGRLEMEEGSHMTLQDGSQLRAWGYMTGKGETDARRGATVHEFFQMGDWKGALTSVQIVGMVYDKNSEEGKKKKIVDWLEDYSDRKIFPVSQYFIQNVESPVKYHPGAVLTTAAAVSEGLLGILPVAMAANDIKIIGVNGRDDAIFLMDNEADAENTWVQKSYLVEQDIQNYDVNSSAHIGSMVIDLGTVAIPGYATVQIRLNSANFDLPITSNMKIHLRSGSMDFQQNTSLIPGSEVEVDKQSTVSISMNYEDRTEAEKSEAERDPKHVYHSGALYVYDAADWGLYAFDREKNATSEKYYTKIVRYAPSWDGKTDDKRPNIRKENVAPVSAKINVHGTFNTDKGFVYTSKQGANIFSSNEDAGSFIFSNAADKAGTPSVYNIEGEGTDKGDYKPITFYPAQLRNGNGNYTDTKDAQQNESYCYTNNQWSKWKVAEADECFMTDGTDYYAKPQEYVKVVVAKGSDGPIVDDKSGHFQGNADHTYSDAAGAGRLFILVGDDCSWWEVEVKDNRYHCVHPDNDTYYQWVETETKDGDGNAIKKGEWQEVRCTITWKNWDGSIIETFGGLEGDVKVKADTVPYGTMAEFLGTNPTRPADIDYTYDFVGWSPKLGRVTSDVTYTAQYERKQRKYTVVFCNEGGTEIERHFLTHNEVPACENTPTKVGHYLQWTPAIAAVTDNATYTAKWLEEKPTEYQVTFVDYNGTTVLQDGKVAAGATPTPPAAPTGKTKENNSEFTYVFDHWSPAPAEVTADITYTAVYREEKQQYKVTFFREDGTTVIETKQWSYGAIPECSTPPTKADDAQYSYSLVWTPQIEAVTKEARYKATFAETPKKYTVTLTSNMSDAVILTGAGIYNYNDPVTVSAEAKDGFKFTGWKETGKTDDITISVAKDVTYTAQVERATPVADHTVKAGEVWDAQDQTVKNLILQSDGMAAGQIQNILGLTVDGNAYFDLSLNAQPDQWYAIAVPWMVNVSDIRFDGKSRTADVNYYLTSYRGDVRAAQGPVDECWSFLTNSDVLQPGTLYMLYLRSAAGTIRFPKKAGASLAGGSVSVYGYAASKTTDAGWNGIANPMAYYASIGAGEHGQKFNVTKQSYDAFPMKGHSFIVGEPVFVQVENNIDRVLVEAATTNPTAAPRRQQSVSEQSAEYEVRIAAQGSAFSDRLYIAAADEKDNAYIIGQDLAKMGVSNLVAQMWIDRYNARLCANTTEIFDSQADFPLGIFVPASGEYTISTPAALSDGDELYVTLDGKPVWSLRSGAYDVMLNAGEDYHYGLLLVRDEAPKVTTDNEQIAANSADVRKVLINGQVYIIRNGNIYSIFGQKIQ